MGFAGQVFAARVAIGLAVPSPKALSKTGSMLAQGVKGIHKRIQMAAKGADLSDEYRKKLARLNQATRSNAQRTSNFIATKLEQNLDKMSKKSIRNTRRVYAQNSKEYKRLTKEMNKPFAQRDLGTFQTSQGMRTMQQMAARMARMNKMERAEQIRHQNNILQSTTRLAEREKKRLLDQTKGKTLSTKQAQKLREQLQSLDKTVRQEKRRLQTLQQIDGELNAINREMDQMDDEGADIGAQFAGAANTLRTNFNDALRNSVAILTAFGFQLHRAGTSVMEFERELINANSVFNLTHDTLFNIGNEIMKFGNEFGIAVQNGAEGMYQLASAGVSANEALAILPETLKLSMAVQGDHNTISKLTAQTLFGFNMEMEEAGSVTDKFAFAIQKSLIEYQDLASAVKFALPFFTSTGQSLDQLLGALAVLTNRALEAGIAGRGLRQAVAEFAESALDAEVGFRKMGVEILNAEGEMKQLTEIAADFAAAVGPDTASNTELLTTLIQDLNVRGATAFIHLVQASDEFTEAVRETENAGGQLDAMIEEQNKSLSAQVQILKTNVLSIFAFRDAAYEGTGFLNAFHESIVETVQGFRDLLVEGEGADQKLTELGQGIQDFAVEAVKEFNVIADKTVALLQDLAKDTEGYAGALRTLAIPLQLTLDIIDAMAGIRVGQSSLLELYIKFKLINSIIPIQAAAVAGLGMMWRGATVAAAGYYATTLAGAAGGGIYTTAGGRFKTAGMKGPGFKTKGALMRTMGGAVGRRGMMAGGAMMLGGGLLPAAAILGGYMLYKHATEKAGGGYITPMAQGGFPSGGAPYLVGEQGPELFMPETSGKLLNNGATENTIGSGMKLNNVTIGIDSFGGLV